jgi:7-keto-8-aminopelargonate synthetase-like enzyme
MIGNRLARSMPTVPVQSAASKARQAFVSHVQKELQSISDAGTYKRERVITSSQSSSISVASSAGQRRVLNFCANNYLGLANSPQLREAAKAAVDSHGLGLSSVRFICGTQDIHKTLEKKIASQQRAEQRAAAAGSAQQPPPSLTSAPPLLPVSVPWQR